MVRKINLFVLGLLAVSSAVWAQHIDFNKSADLDQVYLKPHQSKGLVPMNDLDMEFGYVLYQAEIDIPSDNAVLALENVRDYAVVFIDDQLTGTLTDQKKELSLKLTSGKHNLKLYAENIGRITYGPEILDNSKGLFGSITINNEEIENWTITPLNIKGHEISTVVFEPRKQVALPMFFKAEFELAQQSDFYLDISGWGMGEVWINNKYVGSFWEEEKQQSIQISADLVTKGKNEIVVFEMKNTQQKTMKITDKPVFQK